MSTVPYTSFFTVWQAGVTDEFGDLEYGNPTVFKGLFRQGGNLKLTDEKGQEFSPSSTFWTRLEVVSGSAFTPRIDDLIARGDHRGLEPNSIDTQQIRGQIVHDNSMFGVASDYGFGTK